MTNRTSFHALVGLLLMVLVIGLIALAVGAQTPAKLIGKAKEAVIGQPVPGENPTLLTLTPSEITERDALFKEFSPLQQKINELFGKFLESEEDSAALLVWVKAKRENDKLQVVRGKIMAWMASVQKAHNCPGCELRENTLVKPATQAPPTKP